MTRLAFCSLNWFLKGWLFCGQIFFFNMWLLMEPSKKTHHKANLKKLLVTSFREPRLCIITILHGTPGDFTLYSRGTLFYMDRCKFWDLWKGLLGSDGADWIWKCPMWKFDGSEARLRKTSPKGIQSLFRFLKFSPNNWQLSFYAQGDSPLAPAHCYASSPSFRATGFFSDELPWPVSVDATITGTQ